MPSLTTGDAASTTGRGATTWTPLSALVIDDSRTMRRILAASLTAFGYAVTEAANGQEALDILHAGARFDLATIDWNMPVMDGLTFISHVRRTPDQCDMALVMVTTESQHDQIVRALAAGAHEYVMKPFTPDALHDKLQLLGLV